MASRVVKSLIDKKIEIENEIGELNKVLLSHGTNMTEELVDSEGYPRSDVDVLTVRKTRVRIIYLQNDLKHMMKQIEEGLYKIHGEARETELESKTTPLVPENQQKELKPFLRVDVVTKSSPADKAGVEIDDLVTKFGSITLTNFTGLQMIGSLVQHSKGKEIELQIERNGQPMKIKLTPDTWTGKGLLGCNVVPIK